MQIAMLREWAGIRATGPEQIRHDTHKMYTMYAQWSLKLVKTANNIESRIRKANGNYTKISGRRRRTQCDSWTERWRQRCALRNGHLGDGYSYLVQCGTLQYSAASSPKSSPQNNVSHDSIWKDPASISGAHPQGHSVGAGYAQHPLCCITNTTGRRVNARRSIACGS